MRPTFGNTRCVPMVALPVARSGAMQVVLLGRASSPLGFAGAGAGPGAGAGAGGGGFCETPSPPEQPAVIISASSTGVTSVVPRLKVIG